MLPLLPVEADAAIRRYLMRYMVYGDVVFNAGGFFGHPQGGYGRHLASDGLSFCAKFLSFLGENLVFFMHLVIKTQKN